ncbi:hypothetical protein EfmAA242_09240 [Enterococcus faecium]|nr:hypothetical protein EfmAA242_09240 [Enterococcus faecium]
MLAMGFTGKKAIYFKQKYIEAFNEMEDVIRKNTVPQTIEDMMIYQLEEMKDVKKDVSMLKDTMRISGQQEFEIKQKGNMKVMGVLGGKESRAYEEISKKYSQNFGLNLNVPFQSQDADHKYLVDLYMNDKYLGEGFCGDSLFDDERILKEETE